jgi:hypothetical protein
VHCFPYIWDIVVTLLDNQLLQRLEIFKLLQSLDELLPTMRLLNEENDGDRLLHIQRRMQQAICTLLTWPLPSTSAEVSSALQARLHHLQDTQRLFLPLYETVRLVLEREVCSLSSIPVLIMQLQRKITEVATAFYYELLSEQKKNCDVVRIGQLSEITAIAQGLLSELTNKWKFQFECGVDAYYWNNTGFTESAFLATALDPRMSSLSEYWNFAVSIAVWTRVRSLLGKIFDEKTCPDPDVSQQQAILSNCNAVQVLTSSNAVAEYSPMKLHKSSKTSGEREMPHSSFVLTGNNLLRKHDYVASSSSTARLSSKDELIEEEIRVFQRYKDDQTKTREVVINAADNGHPNKKLTVAASLWDAPSQLNPLQWWKDREQQLPLLSSLAKKVYCIPATARPWKASASAVEAFAADRLHQQDCLLLHDFWKRIASETTAKSTTTTASSQSSTNKVMSRYSSLAIHK